VAVTLSGEVGVLYLDGAAVGTNLSMTLSPSSLGVTANDYIGRSQYSGDPYLNGSIDEFRICNGELSAAEIAAVAALGPDQLLSTNRPTIIPVLAGTNLSFAWSLANPGFTLQSRTNLFFGDWLSVTSPGPLILGSQWQMVVPTPTNRSMFYRLAK